MVPHARAFHHFGSHRAIHKIDHLVEELDALALWLNRLWKQYAILGYLLADASLVLGLEKISCGFRLRHI